jgi:hypothetical protein
MNCLSDHCQGAFMLKPYYRNVALEQRCREKRVTGALISYNSGIHESRFSKILNNRTAATPKEKNKIAQALECTVEEIFQDN